jgi:hypothetical protein
VRGFRICCFSSLLGVIKGFGEYGWVEVIFIAHGPSLCWAGDLTVTNRKSIFSFPIFFFFRVWLHIHRRPRTFTYTTCILSSSIFYICNVDGMYFRRERRVLTVKGCVGICRNKMGWEGGWEALYK